MVIIRFTIFKIFISTIICFVFRIRAYESSDIEKGTVFEIPVTVVQPIVLNQQSNWRHEFDEVVCKPNTILRHFILVPNNASWAGKIIFLDYLFEIFHLISGNRIFNVSIPRFFSSIQLYVYGQTIRKNQPKLNFWFILCKLFHRNSVKHLIRKKYCQLHRKMTHCITSALR